MKQNIRIVGKTHYLRGRHNGEAFEVSLGRDAAQAKIAAVRFLETLEASGMQTAKDELKGKKVIKAATDATFEEITELYNEFLGGTRRVRAATGKANLGALRRVMAAVGAKKVNSINRDAVQNKMLAGNPTPTQERSFNATVRCAGSVFSQAALVSYEAKRNVKLTNPFAGMKVESDKVEVYEPLPLATRTAIETNSLTELDASSALIITLAIFCGLRRSEIEAARVGWLSLQNDKAVFTVKSEEGYIPKSGEKRSFPVSLEIYQRVMDLRAKAVESASANPETQQKISDSPFLVPVLQRKGKGGRLWARFRKVNNWLKTQGINSTRALHCLRKEAGSRYVAETGSIYQTSKFLGHSNSIVTEAHYAGLNELATVGENKKKSIFKEMAETLGISLEELNERLLEKKK